MVNDVQDERARMGMLSTGLFTHYLDTVPMAAAKDYLEELEALGYGSLWVPEKNRREAFVNAALCLSATKSMVVGTGIASIYARTSFTAQLGWRTLTEAFPSRFILGLGASHDVLVSRLHRSVRERPLEAMKRYLDEMDSSRFAGYSPAEQPRRILAALGPKMLEVSASRAIGALPYCTTVDHTRFARERLGDGPVLAPIIGVALSTDREKSREAAVRFTGRFELEAYRQHLRRLGWTDADFEGPSERLLDAIVARGDLDTVVGRVKEHLAAGADHVIVNVLPVGDDVVPIDGWRELAPALTSLARAAASQL
jgi:probable F420-dependent oxidoreductase